MFKTIITKVRLDGGICLVVASSGLAATLLPGGKTAHAGLKIPVKLHSLSFCKIPLDSDMAKLLKTPNIMILWDELPMSHKHQTEAFDRTAKDIMKNTENFGGILMVFGGDFRQTLPVVKKGSKGDIINACFNKSHIWPSVQFRQLNINERIRKLTNQTDKQKQTEFANLLLRIGDGKETRYSDESGCDEYIKLPGEIVQQLTQTQLINQTFPNLK